MLQLVGWIIVVKNSFFFHASDFLVVVNCISIVQFIQYLNFTFYDRTICILFLSQNLSCFNRAVELPFWEIHWSFTRRTFKSDQIPVNCTMTVRFINWPYSNRAVELPFGEIHWSFTRRTFKSDHILVNCTTTVRFINFPRFNRAVELPFWEIHCFFTRRTFKPDQIPVNCTMIVRFTKYLTFNFGRRAICIWFLFKNLSSSDRAIELPFGEIHCPFTRRTFKLDPMPVNCTTIVRCIQYQTFNFGRRAIDLGLVFLSNLLNFLNSYLYWLYIDRTIYERFKFQFRRWKHQTQKHYSSSISITETIRANSELSNSWL